jgi:ubiquinone/menaquinone biosynthesis C-methylase UbiE
VNLPATESDYVRYQYDDSEKLRIRIETHERFTVGETDFIATLLQHIQPAPGLHLLDVGCGPGEQHALLQTRGMRVTGVDLSFGMLREARTAHRPMGYAQGNAVALPFADAQFDRVLCSGVLYHVRDWMAALRELRRVTRRGGRVIVSTNGPAAMQRIVDVHRDAARQLGYTPLESRGATFHTDHHHEVRKVFPSVERHVIESELVFPDAEAALRFYATNRIDLIQDRPEDGSHRARLLPAVQARIEAIIQREGAFRVPKTWGFFVAEVSS